MHDGVDVHELTNNIPSSAKLSKLGVIPTESGYAPMESIHQINHINYYLHKSEQKKLQIHTLSLLICNEKYNIWWPFGIYNITAYINH